MSDVIKIFIIDDSAIVRTTIASLVQSEHSIELIGSANDPIIAMEKFSKYGWPDVIILDIEMPRMDGLTFLRKIMCEHPIPVIICSSVAQKGSKNAIEALSLGALEIMTKPEVGVRDFLEDSKNMFISAIKAAFLAKNKIKIATDIATITPGNLVSFSADAIIAKKNTVVPSTHNIIAIGSSTGGPQTLEGIIKSLPANASPTVIVQHMPAGFTKSLAERLDKLCAVTVKEAEHGDRLLQGRVLLAPGDKHMIVKRVGGSYIAEIKDGPKVNRHKPSVDVLFRSCANEAGSNAIGIILTGMGDDGARGMKEMFDVGAKTYAQDEKSCIVYGMPKEAVAFGGVTRSTTLSEIIEIIKKG
ncbi:MAG: hypothetical protein RL154_277 [Pseudomonadota bacterium]|jgi:two-component system chemotaxis response regulator CheB